MTFINVLTQYIVPITSLCAMGVSIVFSVFKIKKEFNASGTIVLLSKIPSLVQEAERLFPQKGSGCNKLNFVLNQLRIYALENRLKTDENLLISNIEDVVKATKNVNTDIIPSEENLQQDTSNPNNGSGIESGSDSIKEINLC